MADVPQKILDPPIDPPTLAQRLLHWILPSPCLACGEVVWEPRESFGLCPRCRVTMKRWPRPGCSVCATPFPMEEELLPPGYRCESCRRRTPPYDVLLSTWCYQPPVDQTLMALKFRRLDYLGLQLGREMGRLHSALREDVDVVVPVPLYWLRRWTRGFNQADVIARPIAQALGVPCSPLLSRHRPTLHQSRLDRDARQTNLRRAFRVRRPALCRDRRVLLVDDVTTTGATAETAAACLKAAGAAKVIVLTAARAVPARLSSCL
jgi:ComF family protein